jgi:hypothetical protein
MELGKTWRGAGMANPQIVILSAAKDLTRKAGKIYKLQPR